MSGLIKLRVAQGSLSYEGVFSRPAFGLIGSLPSLLDRVYTRMEKFGLRASDLRLEAPTQSLAEACVSWTLAAISAVARIRTIKVEVSFLDLKRIGGDQASAIISESAEAVRDLLPDFAVRSHSINLAVHGLLEGIAFEDFMQLHTTKAPTGLGPGLGCGVVYYFGPEAGRDGSSFVIDKSFVVSGGLFFRANVIIDGTRVAMNQIELPVSNYIKLGLEKLDLELSWSA